VLEILIPGFFNPKRGIKKQPGGKKWEDYTLKTSWERDQEKLRKLLSSPDK